MSIVVDGFTLGDDVLAWSFAKSGGPGGQHVNKTASKAVLRFSIGRSPLPVEVQLRLLDIAKSRINDAGELVISSDEHRDQRQNVAACEEKLTTVIRQALVRPKPRKKTRPTRGSVERRLREKKNKSAIKSQRGRSGDE